jgi:hypothetical protein
MNNTKNSHGRFFGLLKQMPFTTKEELVLEYSNNKTASLSWFRDIMPRDYDRMIQDMQQIVDSMKQPKNKTQQQPSKFTTSAVTKQYRSAILKRLQQHGIDTTNWDRVNSFMENPRIAGKRLYEMSDQEMIDFIPKMESILKKDKQREAAIERLTTMN